MIHEQMLSEQNRISQQLKLIPRVSSYFYKKEIQTLIKRTKNLLEKGSGSKNKLHSPH